MIVPIRTLRIRKMDMGCRGTWSVSIKNCQVWWNLTRKLHEALQDQIDRCNIVGRFHFMHAAEGLKYPSTRLTILYSRVTCVRRSRRSIGAVCWCISFGCTDMLPPFAGLRFSWPDGRKYDGQWSLLTCCALLCFLVVFLVFRFVCSILIFWCIASHVARRDGKQHGTGSYVGMPKRALKLRISRTWEVEKLCASAGQRLWDA